MKYFETDLSNDITVVDYGGKGYWTSFLWQNGCHIPPTILMKSVKNFDSINGTDFFQELKEVISIVANKNGEIAIRSSSVIEDSIGESKAGHFKTYIGCFDEYEAFEKCKEIIQNANEQSDKKMGLVFQEKIDCQYSGVVFSSNPINYSKNEVVINMVQGNGEQLVSGKKFDEELNVKLSDMKVNTKFKSLKRNYLLLIRVAKNLEKITKMPVDIEWGVSNHKLYILQCRPLSSIMSIKNQILSISKEALKDIPYNLKNHHKVIMRLEEENNIQISPASLCVINKANRNKLDFTKLNKSKFYQGYSAVIIYPQIINKKVIRSFIGNSNISDMGEIKNCCRYGIKAFPKYLGIKSCIKELSSIDDEYWINIIILQEVYNPEFTGMITKEKNKYIIEIAKGHFVPKGIVPTSKYIVSNDEIEYSHEVNQTRWYKILEGHIVDCNCNDMTRNLIHLNSEDVLLISQYFKSILDSCHKTIEFGLFEEKHNSRLYMIDYVDNISTQSSDYLKGVISPGKIKGKIYIIDNFNINYSFDMHYQNICSTNERNGSNVIFLCDYPDIALLNIFKNYNSNNIGFIFKNASLLCHFSVILREKRIPAIIVDELDSIMMHSGDIYEIDTDLKKNYIKY